MDEFTIRILRDFVYGQTTTDTNWSSCRDYWLKPENVRWLKGQTASINRGSSAGAFH